MNAHRIVRTIVMLGWWAVVLQNQAQAQTTIYVDANATGPTHDGTSWCTAYLDLQNALTAVTDETKILVADGRYTPTTGTDRTATFGLINGVILEGGYAGCGAGDPDERNIGLFETILSGDLDGDDDDVIEPGPGGGTAGETCAEAGAINDGETAFDTTGATTDGPSDCTANQDIWYVYTASRTGHVVVSLCGSGYDTKLAVYEGSTCPPTTLLACNDDYCDVQSQVEIAVVEGSDYLIRVGGYSDEAGAGVINISYDPRGENSYNVVLANSVDNTAMFDGFTITGGNANGDEAPYLMGGGMFNATSTPMVSNCTFRRNKSNGHGGGMVNYAMSAPIVTNCTFSENSSASVGGGMGGILYAYAAVIDCTFIGNTAVSGGGMYNDSFSPAFVINSVFTGNRAEEYGGGIVNFGSDSTVTNCTFSGNSTDDTGGAIFNYASSPTVTNCTFSGNSASTGGGMYSAESSLPVVANCVFWGDTGGEILNDGASATSVTYSDIQGGRLGAGNINADPLLADADGPDDVLGTDDDNLRLSPGSPCIDVGNNTAVPPDMADIDDDGDTDEPIPFDLDGSTRFIDDPDAPDGGLGDPPIVDMGAYEFVLRLQPPGIPPAPHDAKKNRYISIDTTANADSEVAYQVTVSSMKRCSGDLRRACIVDADCPGVCTGNHSLQCSNDEICGVEGPCVPTAPCIEHSDAGSVIRWVDEPYVGTCLPLSDCGGQWFAHLADLPVYRAWTEDVLHVTGCEIVPVATFEVRATMDGATFSDALVIPTIGKPQVHYGDCVGPVISGHYTPPDGFVSVVDVQAYLIANQGGATAPHTTWIDLHSGSIPVLPQQILNVGDLQTIKFGFLGQTYTETPGHEDPGDCP